MYNVWLNDIITLHHIMVIPKFTQNKKTYPLEKLLTKITLIYLNSHISSYNGRYLTML